MRTLLRLLLSKPARKLINLQRRTNVVEMVGSDDSSSSSDPDFSNDEKIEKFVKKLEKDCKNIKDDEFANRLLKGVFLRESSMNDK